MLCRFQHEPKSRVSWSLCFVFQQHINLTYGLSKTYDSIYALKLFSSCENVQDIKVVRCSCSSTEPTGPVVYLGYEICISNSSYGGHGRKMS